MSCRWALPVLLISQLLESGLQSQCAPWQTTGAEHCYLLYHDRLTWAEAAHTCWQFSGRLVNVLDELIQQEASALLQQEPLHPTDTPPYGRKFWIGARFNPSLSDEIRWESNLAWVVGGYSNWGNETGPPGNETSPPGNEAGPPGNVDTCVAMESPNFTWSTHPCDMRLDGFVCQYNHIKSPDLILDSPDTFASGSSSPALRCTATGYPCPNITWYRDEVRLFTEDDNDKCIFISNDKIKRRSFRTIVPSVEFGRYVCRATVWDRSVTNVTYVFPDDLDINDLGAYYDSLSSILEHLPLAIQTQLILTGNLTFPFSENLQTSKAMIAAIGQSYRGETGQLSSQDYVPNQRSLIFGAVRALSKSAESLSSGTQISLQEEDIDVQIEIVNATGIDRLPQTARQVIWMTNNSLGSLLSSSATAEGLVRPRKVTILRVQFPTLMQDRLTTDGTYSAVTSNVLSYSVLVDSAVVSVPVTYRLPTQVDWTEESRNTTHTWRLQCGFMIETDLTSDWGWSTAGCSLQAVEDGQVLCSCEHTTNFAVLMQVVPIQISEVHFKALSIITYAGCGISMAALCLSLAVFFILRLYYQDRTFIHINLIINLLLLQTVFLTGASLVPYQDLCTAISVYLHYLCLAVFSWMLVEGIHLYRQVVKVFDSARHKKLYALIGYLLPACIVGISAAVHPAGYSDPDRTCCWLSMDQFFHWAFIGPAIFIILVNIIVTGQVLRIVVTAAQVTKQHSVIQVASKGLLVLAPITGLGWVFALMAVSEETIVFQYVFAILNSLQGLFIFLFHCVFNCEVRSAWSLWRSKKSATKKVETQNSGTSHEKRKVSGVSQDTTDKTRLHVTDLRHSPVEAWTLPHQTFSVIYKGLDRMDSGENVSPTGRIIPSPTSLLPPSPTGLIPPSPTGLKPAIRTEAWGADTDSKQELHG